MYTTIVLMILILPFNSLICFKVFKNSYVSLFSQTNITYLITHIIITILTKHIFNIFDFTTKNYTYCVQINDGENC